MVRKSRFTLIFICVHDADMGMQRRIPSLCTSDVQFFPIGHCYSNSRKHTLAPRAVDHEPSHLIVVGGIGIAHGTQDLQHFCRNDRIPDVSAAALL